MQALSDELLLGSVNDSVNDLQLAQKFCMASYQSCRTGCCSWPSIICYSAVALALSFALALVFFVVLAFAFALAFACALALCRLLVFMLFLLLLLFLYMSLDNCAFLYPFPV